MMVRLYREEISPRMEMLLNAWEPKPITLGGRKLVDLETTEEANLQVVEKTIAERGLLDLCGNELCAADILRPT